MAYFSNTVRKVMGDRQKPMASYGLTVEQALARRSAKPGPLEDLFYGNTGRVVHKWTHYLPVYEQAFARFRGTDCAMLEIGVAEGGSLDLWRGFLGPKARIMGIDIKPVCAERVEAPNMVRIGSQADPAFLSACVDELGPPDVILDDGSHVASHIRASFTALWPRLKVGGLYVIEDLHTAYWPDFEGGYRRPGTSIEIAKQLIDDQHSPYHPRGHALAPWNEIGAIHMHDSIVVIEKAAKLAPGHVKIGG